MREFHVCGLCMHRGCPLDFALKLSFKTLQRITFLMGVYLEKAYFRIGLLLCFLK